MKTIFRIAKTELKTLFYSPIAWFLIIIFMVQCSVTYIKLLDSLCRSQESGFKFQFSLIREIFLGRNGLLGGVMRNLYLYLPLLTMGLISRETSSGTIKLLYSSPIHLRDIVLGKYLSMMILSFIMVAIVGLYMVSSYFTISSPDTPMLLSGLLGLFLLLCAYSSIGLFMSCLTNYQIVAAVCTFVTIGILYNVGGLWEGVPFVRDLTYFLSVSGRTDKMLMGLITSKDLIYFGLIIYLFLGLSVYKLKAGMESSSSLVKFGRYTMVIVSTLLLGYISSIPQLIAYLDVTRNKSNTLAKSTQQIVKDLGDEPLEITGYANLLGNYLDDGNPESYNRNIRAWEPYMRFKNNMTLKSVMYYDTLNQSRDFMKSYPGKTLKEAAAKVADIRDMKLSQFLSPEEIRQKIDLSKEPNWYTMQLKYKDRTTFLRVFQDNEHWPSETEVSAALKRLLQTKMPKILFITGNFERNIYKIGDREYRAITNLKTFRNSLLNQGFDVDTISLENTPIPTDIAALVLADPKTVLSPVVLSKLQQYIDRGGNLFISGEPGKQALLNPLLKQFDVQLMEGAIVQQSKDLAPELATPYLTSATAALYAPLEHAHHDSAVVSMPLAAALSYSDSGTYHIKPFLMTDAKTSWLKRNKFVTDSAAVKFEPHLGDRQESFPLIVGLTRKINGKEQRIVISGDADFMSNAEAQRFNMRTANFVFSTGLFSWLNYGRFPINTYRPPAIDIKVLVTKEQVRPLRIIFIWVLPGILLACGSILLLRRKRK
ncbi:ABC-2 type transport system permease protein [Pedobacter sp. ok626]|uniref:Gldg family protein n=1 Tax=Pedobacter sp. ok626 TaxID=1761882 RepID=UPI0008861200|nr:Gldg family protein [Pedobacter sp. ok626]SDJ93623.1 ABC-2 type transport system permease protein [Pedobacter sp. ok626]